MELYEVMRPTFSAHGYSGEELPNSVPDTILEKARFAASGGNRHKKSRYCRLPLTTDQWPNPGLDGNRNMLKQGLCIVLLSVLLASCAHYTDRRGVEVTWQPQVLGSFQLGATTRSEVLKALGPPSQVITLDDETVLYYLYERSEGQGYILFLYNRLDVKTRYDRAVLFFDGDDRLTEYASYIGDEND